MIKSKNQYEEAHRNTNIFIMLCTVIGFGIAIVGTIYIFAEALCAILIRM